MNEQVTHILLVEDAEAHAELVSRAFEEHRERFRLTVVASLAEARACLAEASPVLIIADLRLPDGLGTDLLAAEGQGLVIPLVVMTAQGDERAAVESMKAGALDYLVKSDEVLADMPHIAERALREWHHITERKRADEAVRESETRYRDLCERAPIAYFSVDPDGSILRANRRASEMFGYPENELVGRRVTDLYADTPAGIGRAREVFDLFASGWDIRDVELEYRRADGRHIWGSLSVDPKLDAEGQVMASRSTVVDVTERKRAQERDRLQATALESAANGIVITDRDGRISWVNGAFTTLTGYTAQEVAGQNPRVLKSGKQDPDFYRNLWDTIASGRVWRGEIVNRRKDGSLYTEDMTVTPVRNQDGEIANFIAIKQDVTERKLLQEQLAQAQKMEAVGQLGGGVAHDFNNLLTAIQGYAELGLDDLPGEHPARDYFIEVQKAAGRGASITRQLLIFAKRQPTELTVLNLNDLVLNITTMLRRLLGEDIELVGLMAPDLGMVNVDPGLMEQVMVNMAVNASHAMPDGGKLTIQTANVAFDPESALQFADLTPGRYVRLSLSDTGIGMDEEIKAHLFEPFYTSKEPGKGTGLGLATCYGIVKQNGGDISVSSEPGQGATFNVYLPRVGGTSAAEAEGRESGELPRGTETVLLVEDEVMVRGLASHVLQRQGYTVLEADNGEEALRLVREHGGDRIHLLLTDVVMPQMGGQALASRLMGLFPTMNVLFTSGYVGGGPTALAEGSGALIPFLPKPFLPRSLAQKVREVLDAARVGR